MTYVSRHERASVPKRYRNRSENSIMELCCGERMASIFKCPNVRFRLKEKGVCINRLGKPACSRDASDPRAVRPRFNQDSLNRASNGLL